VGSIQWGIFSSEYWKYQHTKEESIDIFDVVYVYVDFVLDVRKKEIHTKHSKYKSTMASYDTPNQGTSRRTRSSGGTSHSRDRVPEEIEDRGNSQGSAISALSGSVASNSIGRRIARRNQYTLSEFAVSSPITPGTPTVNDGGRWQAEEEKISSDIPAEAPQQQGPLDEEDANDTNCYFDNAGASDSEDKPEDVNNQIHFHSNEVLEARHAAEEDNRVAQALEEDFIAALEEEQEEDEDVPWCHGAPIGWKPPQPPDGWTPAAAKVDKGEPESFNDIDNPGDWNSCVYQPKFEKGKYVHHALPTGATPVPPNGDSGSRHCEGWEFHYNGWKSNNNNIPNGADRDNLFPADRLGCLDKVVLRRLGLNSGRMLEDDGAPDALFFYQLILPIHLIDKRRGILPVADDPRQSFYAQVSKWTNLYAVGELDLGSGYGWTPLQEYKCSRALAMGWCPCHGWCKRWQ
jgi:hypothetical protein